VKTLEASRGSARTLQFTLLHCALASCGAVYCNRSCLWMCSGRAGGRCPNLTTASARAVFVSLWALFFQFDQYKRWHRGWATGRASIVVVRLGSRLGSGRPTPSVPRPQFCHRYT